MVLNFAKLNNATVDPEQLDGNKPAFRLFSDRDFRVEPLERAEITTGIMLFGAPNLIIKVFPSVELLINSGVACLPTLITGGGEVKVPVINVTIPDFLYVRNEAAKAHSAFFGSHNSFEIEKGQEIATILIEKSLEKVSLREII